MTRTHEISARRLAAIARNMLRKAHAPYSNFKVGAALESVSGEVFTGCNVENASYGLTICAEQSAVAHAVARGHSRFRRLVIVTASRRAVPPCGACRQVLAEFADNMDIISFGSEENAQWRLRDLIPDAFSMNEWGEA